MVRALLERTALTLLAIAGAAEAAALVPAAPTCQTTLKHLPFCNRSLPVSERVADLLPRLTLTEKIGQTGMVATAVPQWGMVQYNFGGEALHGVWASCVVDNITTASHTASGKTLCPTQFPAPVHMASSFNRDLWRQMADVSSTEARALCPGLQKLGAESVFRPRKRMSSYKFD